MPADRSSATGALDTPDGPLDQLTFLLAAEPPRFLPAPAVCHRLVPGGGDVGADLRVVIECPTTAVEGGGHPVLVQDPRESPGAGPALVLEGGLDAEIRNAEPGRVDREPELPDGLPTLVARLVAVLGARLVV